MSWLSELMGTGTPVIEPATIRDAPRLAQLHGTSFHRGWRESEFERMLAERNTLVQRLRLGRKIIGFAVSLFYGLIHKLWLPHPPRTMARVQFALHQAATLVVSLCLLLLYGGVLPEATIGPVLGVASAGVLAGVLLMSYMVVNSSAAPA